MIGLSLRATAIDSSDLVADSVGTYALGLSCLVTNWVGVSGGSALLANRIAIPMYWAGMFSNAEYLEALFSLAARVDSGLVQALYRTLVLGIVATALQQLREHRSQLAADRRRDGCRDSGSGQGSALRAPSLSNDGWLGQGRVASRADRPAPLGVAWLPAALGTATLLSFVVFW